ncbi:NADPH oxidase organizer 1-like [Clinocottus analis]|uniref:NADPH oxidase organizer 1-like n=1 Tax=Clinocottus analis TaxID=304258 RepID=UPI0035C08A37
MAGEQRFVISARIIGSLHRDTPKLKMFKISVLWSDKNEVIVYRSFKDFKKFHMLLKKRFPHMNTFRKNDRAIPKFKGQARRNSLQQKGSNRSVQRMKFLESYCDQLFKCDQIVTQSSIVFQFFTPKDQDLQPDFTKNSIMILMSDDLPDGSGGGGGDDTRQHACSVTHTFVTQAYRCVADFETKDGKNRPFKVSVDEKLDVLIKDPAGWWLVENKDKILAWFPAPYLELWEGEDDDDDDDDDGFQFPGALYCAVRSYSAKRDDEVSVPIGSVVEVLRKSDDGWWLIRFNGKSGYVPSMNLKPYNNLLAGLYSMQRKLHGSTLNLATSRKSQAPRKPGTNKENSSQWDSAGESRVPGRFQKARSLDVLSENWSPTLRESDASTSNGRVPSLSNTSTERKTSTKSNFSDYSSSSESTSTTGSPTASFQPGVSDSGSSIDLSFFDRRESNTSSDSSGYVSSTGSETAPRVQTRPKTNDILARCTTMARKAGLTTKTQL